jgi:hypothetical protein
MAEATRLTQYTCFLPFSKASCLLSSSSKGNISKTEKPCDLDVGFDLEYLLLVTKIHRNFYSNIQNMGQLSQQTCTCLYSKQPHL